MGGPKYDALPRPQRPEQGILRIRKELGLRVSLHTLLQILSLTMFEKTPLQQALVDIEGTANPALDANQLNLFNS